MTRRLLLPVLLVFLSAGTVLASGNSVGAAKGPAEDGTMPSLVSIAGQGMMNSHTFEYLTELSDEVGGRVTGTPEAEQVIAWAEAKMKAIGLGDVRREKWQMSRGWQHIFAEAVLVAPVRRKLSVDSMGWVGSTPQGGAEGDVVAVNMYGLADEMKNASRWSGKVILVTSKGAPPKDFMMLFARFGDFLKAAKQAGAMAVIGGQGGSKSIGMHLTHTGALGFDTTYEIPVVSMTAEGQGLLERFIERGKTVRLRINAQNRLTPGPVESANVVGEIRGREHPEQVAVRTGRPPALFLVAQAARE